MERYHIFKLGLAILFYAAYCIRPMMVNCLKIDDAVGSTNNETKNFIDEDYVYYQGVQGKPGVDFPVLAYIPRTTFNCRNVDSGYYADLETDCQVFHICEEGKKISFLCPNGTIFQQSELICEWWFKVNCTNSPSLYEESAEQLREENARRKSSRRVVQNHGAVMRTEEHSSVSTSQNSRSFDVNNRATKKVSDRINNHAPNYRTSPDEDLTRESSSDFYRNRGSTNKPAPFTTSSPTSRKPVQRNRPDYDYQRGDDYQDYEDQPRKHSSRNNNHRKPVSFRNNNRRNQEERKPVSFRNNNDFQSRQNQQNNNNFDENKQNGGFQQRTRFDDRTQQKDFNEEKSIPLVEDNNNYDNQFDSDNFEQKTVSQSSDNGFDKPKPVSDSKTTDFQQNNSKVSQPIALSVTESTNINNQFRNPEHKPGFGNKNTGFQQNNRFSNQHNLRATTERNTHNNQQFGFHNSRNNFNNQKPVSTTHNTGFNRNTAFSNNNFNTKETYTVSTTEGDNNYNNQQLHLQESVSRVSFQQENDNQQFGVGNKANHKPVSNNRRTGFQQNVRSNFNVVSTTDRNKHFGFHNLNQKSVSDDKDIGFQQDTSFSNKVLATQTSNFNHEPVSGNQHNLNPVTEPSDDKPASDIQNRIFHQIRSFNEEFISNDKEPKSSSTGRTLEPIPLSSGFQGRSNEASTTVSSITDFHPYKEFKCNFTHHTTEVVPTTTETATDQPTTFHEDLTSTTTAFQETTSRTLEPLPLSSGFQNRNYEESTTISSSIDSHPHKEFNCNSTHHATEVVPTTTETETDQPTTIYEDLTSTIASFLQSTSRTLQPLPLSSGFYIQTSDESTTTPEPIEGHHHKEFPCNSTHKSGKKVVLSSTSFPNHNQEATFRSGFQNQNKKSVNTSEGKDSTIKQKSTVPLTRNDIVNRRLEPSDSDEAQITEETASFYKNSANRIDEDYKTSTSNPHPNHRETYSELKEPKYYSNKILSAISSVTPQYLTTQPINSGRPFIGSQVGTTLIKNITGTSTISYFTTTQRPTTSLFNLGRTDSFTTRSTTGKIVYPAPFSTRVPVTTANPLKLSVPDGASSYIDTSSTSRTVQASTKKAVDRATVYGKFAKSSATTPSNGRISLTLSKTLSGTPKIQSGNVKTSAEILSTSDSSNAGTPQVRFFGKVHSSGSKTPGVEIRFNGGNSKTSPTKSNSFSTTLKPQGKAFGFGSTSPASINSLSTTPKSISLATVSERVPTSFSSLRSTPQPLSINDVSPDGFNSFSTTPRPFGFSTTPSSGLYSFNYFTTTPREEVGTTTPSPNPFGTTFAVTTTDAPKTTPVDLNSFSTGAPRFKPTESTTLKSQVSGFYVTKNAGNGSSTGKSLLSDINRPRPFDLPPDPDYRGRAVYSTTDNAVTTTPTFPTYKISSASPFKVPVTQEPTQPTPFTSKSILPSTFENVDSMINALAEMANQNDHSGDSPRPGLVIPPSAGPQTLHTLAVYFANALDGIASDKEDEEDEEEDEESLTARELEKKRLTELLTQMTMNRYNELFSVENEDEETTTVAVASRGQNEDNDLEGQHSKSPTTPKVRQLARVFTQALSSYLDDPATFKKVLEEIRPTEPPATEKEETTDLVDDELLNFSDADSKSSFPPFYPTLPSVRPTWGYLIAYNTSKTVDVKNSINPEENLQGADSQSFVSQLNKLQNDNKEITTKSSLQLPEDHWTASPGVTKLWSTAFTFDPASINENFGTTEATATITEQETEAPETLGQIREINYELRALPQLELNSTQVHGILIDFMNTTKSNNDNRLQRILRKLNTTEDEFLAKMKEIEGNPLTRRLILLLISECGVNATAEVNTQAVPVHTLLSRNIQKSKELLETSSSIASLASRQQVEGQPVKSSGLKEIVDPSLDEDTQDARALQLLNSLYTIASRFGK